MYVEEKDKSNEIGKRLFEGIDNSIEFLDSKNVVLSLIGEQMYGNFRYDGKGKGTLSINGLLSKFTLTNDLLLKFVLYKE